MTDTEHFDGLIIPDERSPDGFAKIEGIGAVLVNADQGKLVLTGEPTPFHNCDQRGCGSLEHKIAEFDVNPELFYQESDKESQQESVGTDNDGGD